MKPELSSPQSITKANSTYPWGFQHILLKSLHSKKFYKVPKMFGLVFGMIHFTLLQDTDKNLDVIFVQANI